MLVESAPSHHVCFQAIVDFRHELERKRLMRRPVSDVSIARSRSTALTLRIVVAGMQCVSKSYSFALVCMILAGDLSSTISFAMTSISASQSGGGMGVFSLTLSLSVVLATSRPRKTSLQTHFCACTASNIKSALLKFLPLSLATLASNPSQPFNPSFFPTLASTS